MKTKSPVRAAVRAFHLLAAMLAASGVLTAAEAKPSAVEEEITSTRGERCISGVYPHLTAYSQSFKSGRFGAKGLDECGIGAVIPWADRLWMVTYAPHMPKGSSHKLYSIDKDLTMTLHPESVGGTPAARMIHVETNQLLLGHYLIDSSGRVRVISPLKMPGRITAFARHLSDPANLVYYYDMEGMLYEVNVRTLEFKLLFKDPIPGEHGKGAYTSQGKLVLANNGLGSPGHIDKPDLWQVSKDHLQRSPEDRGCLATFDGRKWEVIEQRQFTDVTGPEGVRPTVAGKDLPLWTMGWDKRSVRLKVLDGGTFHTYLLPKGCINNDASHGWFTEWPRIREIGGGKALLDMHGMFYDFPLTFKPGHTAGLQPIGRHLRYVPDFCDWNGRLVIASDEASIQGNPLCGQPQSNLWFGKYDDLKTWGEASAAGAIWVEDKVLPGAFSDPFLVRGFKKRVAHFASDVATVFTLEADLKGDGNWSPCATIQVGTKGYGQYIFPTDFDAQWVRVKSAAACTASVSFHFSDTRSHDPNGAGKSLFAPLADAAGKEPALTHLIFPTNQSRDLNVITMKNGKAAAWNDLDHEAFAFKPAKEDMELLKRLDPKPEFTVDAASVVISSEGRTLRLPKGDAAYDQPFADGWPRSQREVESERLLANIHGTFYEVPFWFVGKPGIYYKMKPVCSHQKRIMDYATWRGLLVLSGVREGAPASEHLIRSADGKQALWAGGIDDLWKLGKPVGSGGPWLDSAVKAGEPSDPYLMNGYDRKSVTLKTDKDCVVTLEVDFDLQSGFHTYRSFTLKAGVATSFEFPDGFAAHWVRAVADLDCTATAQFVYQ